MSGHPAPVAYRPCTSIHIHQHRRAIHLPDWKMGSEESLTFTLCWIVLTWHLTCWLMRNIMAWRKSKVKDEWVWCRSSRHISEPQLFINLLFSSAAIHPCLCYTSRIGSVISGIYLHLSRSSPVWVFVCVCVCEGVRVSAHTKPMYLNWPRGPRVNWLEVALSAAYYYSSALQ